MTSNFIAGMYVADFDTFFKLHIPQKKKKKKMDNEFPSIKDLSFVLRTSFMVATKKKMSHNEIHNFLLMLTNECSCFSYSQNTDTQTHSLTYSRS